MSDTYNLDDATSLPPAEKHWIIPGAISEGRSILLLGQTGSGKSLVAAEAAVSANTFTRFMGAMKPWVAARSLILSEDVRSIALTVQRLMNGRNEDDTSGLNFMQPSNGVGEIRAFVHASRTRLVVLDDVALGFTPKGIRELLNLCKDGITVIATQQTQRVPTGGGVSQNDSTLRGFDAALRVEKNHAVGSVRLSTIDHQPIVEATPVFDRDCLAWEPFPSVRTTKLEADVWRALYHLKASTVGGVAKALSMNDKARKRLVQEALDDLEKKGAVTNEKQYVSVSGKQHRVWRVVLPGDNQ